MLSEQELRSLRRRMAAAESAALAIDPAWRADVQEVARHADQAGFELQRQRPKPGPVLAPSAVEWLLAVLPAMAGCTAALGVWGRRADCDPVAQLISRSCELEPEHSLQLAAALCLLSAIILAAALRLQHWRTWRHTDSGGVVLILCSVTVPARFLLTDAPAVVAAPIATGLLLLSAITGLVVIMVATTARRQQLTAGRMREDELTSRLDKIAADSGAELVEAWRTRLDDHRRTAILTGYGDAEFSGIPGAVTVDGVIRQQAKRLGVPSVTTMDAFIFGGR